MPEEEEKDLLKKLEGNWHIQVLEKMPKRDGKYRIQDPVYDQVMVQDNFYVLSGGTRIGFTMKQFFHFYQGPKQEIYCDYIGSQLVKMDCAVFQLFPVAESIYPLVICYIAIENGHLVRGFTN